MPYIDSLIRTISQKLSSNAPQETTYFSTIDLQKGYGNKILAAVVILKH